MNDAPDSPEALLAHARATTDDLEARLLLAACAAQAAREVGARLILTGGTAVDFYVTGALGTSSGYPAMWRPSGDVDVVVLAAHASVSARKDLTARLEKLGLEPQYFTDVARVIKVPGFPFYLEIVADELGDRSREERTVTILVDGRVPLETRSPENVVLAYAESGWHFRHSGDWTRALAVFSAMRDRLDMEWMRSEAERRGQRPALAAIEAQQPLGGGR